MIRCREHVYMGRVGGLAHMVPLPATVADDLNHSMLFSEIFLCNQYAGLLSHVEPSHFAVSLCSVCLESRNIKDSYHM